MFLITYKIPFKDVKYEEFLETIKKSAFINTVEVEESKPTEDRYELLVTNLKVAGLSCNFYSLWRLSFL